MTQKKLDFSMEGSQEVELHDVPIVLHEPIVSEPFETVEGSLMDDLDDEDEDEEEDSHKAGLLSKTAKATVLITSFVDILGFSLPNPVLPYYYSTLDGFSVNRAGLIFGLIMSAFSVGQFIGSLVAGAASDRWGRRLPILCCLCGNAACLVYTAFAPSVIQLIVARGLAGLFAGTQGVCAAFVADLTSRAERPKELAHLSAATTIGFIAGPALGIAIGLAFGMPRIHIAFEVICLVAAGIATFAFVMGLFFLRDSSQVAGAQAQVGLSAEEASRGTLQNIWIMLWKRNVVLVLLVTCLAQFIGTAFEASLPLLLVQEEAAPIWQVLVVFAVLAISTPPMAGLVYPFLSTRVGQKLTIIIGLGMCGLGMILMPVFLFWYLQACFSLLLSFSSLQDPALQLIASFSAGRSYGTMMGMLRSIGAFARIFGPFVSGFFYDVDFGQFIGRHRLLPFWFGAACCFAACVITLFMSKTDPKQSSKKV